MDYVWDMFFGVFIGFTLAYFFIIYAEGSRSKKE